MVSLVIYVRKKYTKGKKDGTWETYFEAGGLESIYRWEDGAKFDHEYYNTSHMEITKEALKNHGLVRLESDSFILDKEHNTGDIIAASNAYFKDIDSAVKAMKEVGQVLLADLPNYTTLKPDIKLVKV